MSISISGETKLKFYYKTWDNFILSLTNLILSELSGILLKDPSVFKKSIQSELDVLALKSTHQI